MLNNVGRPGQKLILHLIIRGAGKIQKAILLEDSFSYFKTMCGYYLLDKKSLTLSLCTIASLKVYAPVLGLRTALITLLQFFASAAAFWSFVLIAVLAAFAILKKFCVYSSGLQV
jgi:hypothetical protein